MSENSLFAILMRSPWWISFAVAAVIALLGKIIASGEYFSYGVAFTLPFIVVGSIAAWRQRDEPSAARIEETIDAVSAMSWREFSGLMQKAFERDGFTVKRIDGAADFLLEKQGRTSVVCCKRWKAASQGVEPLRELEAAREVREAREALYVSANGVSDVARQFAKEHRMALMLAPQLARLLRLPRKPLPRQ